MDDKSKLERLEGDVLGLFSNTEAKSILWEIYKFCEVYRANEGINRITGGSDMYLVGVGEGKRRVGLYIESLLSVIPAKDLAEWKERCAYRDKAEDMQDVKSLHDILGTQLENKEN